MKLKSLIPINVLESLSLTARKIDGKPLAVDTISIGGVDKSQGPDDGTVDAFADYAEFEDGTELTDAQIEKLNDEHNDLIIDLAIENFQDF